MRLRILGEAFGQLSDGDRQSAPCAYRLSCHKVQLNPYLGLGPQMFLETESLPVHSVFELETASIP